MVLLANHMGGIGTMGFYEGDMGLLCQELALLTTDPVTCHPARTKVARSALRSGLYNYDMVRYKNFTGYCGLEASHQWLGPLVRLKRTTGNTILYTLGKTSLAIFSVYKK